VGIALQGIGVTMIVSCLLHLFRLSWTLGSVYVAMRRCISRVASFLITYLTVTVAFALGLHFVMKTSYELCDAERAPNMAGVKSVCFSNRTRDEQLG